MGCRLQLHPFTPAVSPFLPAAFIALLSFLSVYSSGVNLPIFPASTQKLSHVSMRFRSRSVNLSCSSQRVHVPLGSKESDPFSTGRVTVLSTLSTTGGDLLLLACLISKCQICRRSFPSLSALSSPLRLERWAMMVLFRRGSPTTSGVVQTPATPSCVR